MKYGWLILVFFIVGLVTTIVILQLTTEKPKQTQVQQFVNITLISKEYNNNKNEVVGYNITSPEIPTFLITGQTLQQGSVLEQLPINYTFQISYFSLPNYNKYYSNVTYVNTKNTNNLFLTLNVIKKGSIKLSSDSILGQDNPLKLIVSLDNGQLYQNIYVCMNLGFHLLNVDMNYTQEYNNPYLNQYDTCYFTNTQLNNINSSKILDISYVKWANLTYSDTLNVTVGDMNCANDNCVPTNDSKQYIFKTYK